MSVTEQRTSLRLADHTTLRVGGPARRIVAPQTVPELIELVGELDAAGEPVLVMGGGSNLLVGDDGFDGTVIKVDLRGIQADESGCAGAIVTVAAGENWDDFVAYAIGNEWSGVEALSGIPGLVGATPIQNVGAYGSEVSQTIQTVRTLDRRTGRQATFAMAGCRFSYRSSRFKSEPDRYVILAVTFQFRFATRAAPIRYAELARTLGVEMGARPPAADVRAAVLDLRRSKGMVLDAADHDTWTAGSFFTNPVLDSADAYRLPPDAPRWPQPDGTVKTSAAWLIERAGFGKGFGLAGDGKAPARLSTKHPLALSNRGSATAADLVALAREVRSGVRSAYGITLAPEPVLIGCAL